MHDFMDNYQNATGFDYSPEMQAEFMRAGEQCSAGSKWESDCEICLNFTERLILSSDEITGALRTGGSLNPKDHQRFLTDHNWIKKKIRVAGESNPVWRWVHAERYEQAGTNKEAQQLDKVAASKIDERAIGELRVRCGYSNNL